MINAVIMAGGKGERFWPKSRNITPKQLISIISRKTMIEETIERLDGLLPIENIFISTRAELVEPIQKIMTGSGSQPFPEENYIAEPIGRDTAACVGLAAVTISKKYPGSVMAVLAADHLIEEKDIFLNDLKNAANVAVKTGCLITFGIKPSRAETGYGYIERGELIESEGDIKAYEVKKFTEKPDLETAKKFISSGRFFWNSGMFVWTTNAILEAIEKYMPDLFSGLLEIQEVLGTEEEDETKLRIFKNLEKVSIDYGVMEKADNTLCFESKFRWDDVGSWTSLERLKEKEENDNLISGDFVGIDTRNSIINSESGIVATIGINNLIIINTSDAVLILDKSREQDVKKLVKLISENENFNKYL